MGGIKGLLLSCVLIVGPMVAGGNFDQIPIGIASSVVVIFMVGMYDAVTNRQLARAAIRKLPLVPLFRKFDCSLNELADELNKLAETMDYEDDNVVVGKNGLSPKQLPRDAQTKYEGFTLFKDVIALALWEDYENKKTSGISSGYSRGTGLMTGQHVSFSNEQVLSGYRVIWCDRWGFKYELCYPINFKESANKVYKLLSRRCKNAKTGLFADWDSFVSSHQEELPACGRELSK